MASRYVPGLTPTFRTPAASSYVPGLTPSLQAPRTAAYEVPNWLQHGNGTGAVGSGGNKVGLYTGQGKYTLYDNRTGKVLAEGSSPEELKNISDIISGTLVPQGNKADWRLYSSNPVIQNQPHREFLGGGEGPLKLDGNPFGDTIQGYNDLSTPGDPRGMVIAGDMPNNFVKDMLVPLLTPAALAAGAYFGGGALLGAKGAAGAGSLASITPASAANAVLPGLAGSVAPVAGGVGGAAITGAGGLAGLGAVAPNVITVLAPTAGGLSAGTLGGIGAGALGAGTLASGGAGSGATSSGAASGGGQGITVTANKLIPTVADKLAALTPGLGPGLAQALTQPPTSPPKTEVPTTEDQIVVEARKTPFPIKMTDIVPPLTSVPLSTLPSTPPTPPKTEVDSGLSTMDKIRLGLLGAGLLSDLAGGGGGSGGTIPGGLGGGRSPIFTAKLPPPNMPVSTPRTASDMGNIDYYRYGYGPEQSFYTNVPKGEPNTSRAYTGYEEREPLAEGGQPTPRSNFAVGGPGDGRDDKIPAMLSDGEYVIDAETVALLGNGSNKAGAEALNKFRVNVRKHKGGKLAKGAFSVAAKRPEQYLKGRK